MRQLCEYILAPARQEFSPLRSGATRPSENLPRGAIHTLPTSVFKSFLRDKGGEVNDLYDTESSDSDPDSDSDSDSDLEDDVIMLERLGTADASEKKVRLVLDDDEKYEADAEPDKDQEKENFISRSRLRIEKIIEKWLTKNHKFWTESEKVLEDAVRRLQKDPGRRTVVKFKLAWGRVQCELRRDLKQDGFFEVELIALEGAE
ncbi:hypothetical protein B0H63DRAFT_95079 [Podospora didyma]|uniref:Uncharacterized protein n=1 Tax=Podospora didyma TaxID=330526 RepID=A0AAE0U369_9PEZI|nr:hypothetical protein B0H63DRAFT_95079 [Podospora didyma]